MPSRTIPLDLPQTLAGLDERLTAVEKALAKLKHDAKPAAKPKSTEPDRAPTPVDSTLPSRPFTPTKSGGAVEYTARQPSERFAPTEAPNLYQQA